MVIGIKTITVITSWPNALIVVLDIGWLDEMGNANSNGEKMKKNSIIGRMIARIVKREKWSTSKIILVAAVLLLPFGPLAVASYFGVKELLRRRKEND